MVLCGLYPSARNFTPSHSPFLGVWSPLGVVLCPCAANVMLSRKFRKIARAISRFCVRGSALLTSRARLGTFFSWRRWSQHNSSEIPEWFEAWWGQMAKKKINTWGLFKRGHLSTRVLFFAIITSNGNSFGVWSRPQKHHAYCPTFWRSFSKISLTIWFRSSFSPVMGSL